MKRKTKYLIGLILFFTLLFGFYTYKLRTLAVEGNKIFEERCTQVNPHLISYKNAFLQYADYLNDPTEEKLKEVGNYLNDYVEGMRNYVIAENEWLDKNEVYMNKWDFKMFEPWYLKEVANYQHEMYRGYRDESLRMLERVDEQRMGEEFNSMFAEARDRRIHFENLYFEKFDEAVLIKDWRKIFGRVPIPVGCTEENMQIPNTSGSVNWGTPTPEPVLIDPENVS